MFTYIHSLLIEKDDCDRQNISIKFPCVCMCLSYGDLFNSFPLFCVVPILSYPYFSTFFFHLVTELFFLFSYVQVLISWHVNCRFSDVNVSDEEDDDVASLSGPQYTFADEETKSHFTNYSMSSSVIRRNEQLTLLDDRFEQVSW